MERTHNRPFDTIIIGGGITGLAALHARRKEGKSVLLLEASDRVGGTIRSGIAPWGGTIEFGPNTLRGGAPELNGLIDEIGLRAEVIETDPSARDRFLLIDGTPTAVPTSPKEGIETALLSIGGKLRTLLEPFRGTIDRSVVDESISTFVGRRLGQEVVERLVDPFVSGIYAGDPAKLSLKHTFPLLDRLERDHGSLLRGMLREKKKRARSGEPAERRRPFSFRGGLAALPERIANLYASDIHLEEPVTSFRRGESGGWEVSSAQGSYGAGELILATGVTPAATLLRSVDPLGAGILDRVVCSPVAVLSLLYKSTAFAEEPRGFGMLIPAREERKILGVIYSSSIFPERTPDGMTQVTLFIGGARAPELTEQSPEELFKLGAEEMQRLYRLESDPVDHISHIWRPGIPQYTTGYDEILEGIAACERRHPGLQLLGSYRGGVSVPDRVVAGSR